MKTTNYMILSYLFLALMFSSCEYDNYDEPTITLNGRVVMDGDVPLNTRHGAMFKLYQYKEDGFIAANAKGIDVFTDQEGRFSALLFPGRYKMVVNTAIGVNIIHTWNDFPRNETTGALDTLYFDLNGRKELKFGVTPYFRINDFEAIYRNDSIIGNFVVEQLRTPQAGESANDFKLRSVGMYIGPTNYVNSTITPLVQKAALNGADALVVGELAQLKCSLKDYYSNKYYKNNYRKYAYVRVALNLRMDAQEFVYSAVIRVSGIPDETVRKFKE